MKEDRGRFRDESASDFFVYGKKSLTVRKPESMFNITNHTLCEGGISYEQYGR